MKPSDHQKVIDIFNAALELPDEQHEQFLSEACGTDAELRKEVESLLASHDEEFLEENVSDSAWEVIRGGLLPGDLVSNRFRIIKMIGRGGMGEVYLARDLNLKRDVALKALAPTLGQDKRRLESFRKEALTVSRIQHKNILTVYDLVKDDDSVNFIVTEYIKGETLRRKLGAGPLDPAVALTITCQIASALEAAHESGFIHRDVKPENIIVKEDGQVKVLDFGIAKLIEPEPRQGEPSQTGINQVDDASGFGTENYLSCEQVRGQRVDERTDIWSLGVCLYEMLAGVPPFKGELPIDTFAAILQVEPAPLGYNVPDELTAVVGRMLQKNRDDRYQTIAEFRSDLERLSPERADTFKKWRSSRGKEIWQRLIYGATLSLLVTAVVASAIYFPILFDIKPENRVGWAALGAQMVGSGFHVILIIFAIHYFYTHPGPKGFRSLASDIMDGSLKPNITYSTGYENVADWKRAREIAEEALKDYRVYFWGLLSAWLFLYLVAVSMPLLGDHPITSLFTQTNNLNTLCIWLCFRILNEPITTENRAADTKGINITPGLKAQAGLVLITIGVMLLWFFLELELTQYFAECAKLYQADSWQALLFKKRAQNTHQGAKLISGIFGGVAMALFVGRFQSKFLKSPDKTTDQLIIVLYFYTVIQTLFIFFGDDTEEGKWWAAAVIHAALYLKCLLILYMFWLFQSGRLLFYLVRVRRASDQVVSEWQNFREVLRPEGGSWTAPLK